MSLPATVPSTMDFSKIRKTEDGKVSVVDVIAQIKDCKGKYASEVYKRLLAEERVPECEVRNIAHITSERSSAFLQPTYNKHSHRHSCRDCRDHMAASRRQ